jgi:hypothetical protein
MNNPLIKNKKPGTLLLTACKKSFGPSLVLLLLLLVSMVSFRSPDDGNQHSEYISMRIYENFTVTSSRIVIVYADDKSEIIDLAPFKFNDDYLVKNNQIITQTLNKLAKLGYRIVTSTSNGNVASSRNMQITTFILEK